MSSWANAMDINTAYAIANDAKADAEVCATAAASWRVYACSFGILYYAHQQALLKYAPHAANELEQIENRLLEVGRRTIIHHKDPYISCIAPVQSAMNESKVLLENAAAKFVSQNQNSDESSAAPSYVDLEAKNKALAHELKSMKVAYAGILAMRNALYQSLGDLDPAHPLVNEETGTLQRVRGIGQMAYTFKGDSFKAARDAGDTYIVPGRDCIARVRSINDTLDEQERTGTEPIAHDAHTL
jgi:hypothetical protein